jgi:hypothetical protein
MAKLGHIKTIKIPILMLKKFLNEKIFVLKLLEVLSYGNQC